MTPFRSVLVKLLLLAGAVGFVLALGWPADDSPLKPASSLDGVDSVGDEPRVVTPGGETSSGKAGSGEAGSIGEPAGPSRMRPAPASRVPPRPISGRPASATGSSPTQLARVDLNRATAKQLQELPGIGETLARRVVHHREAQGTFRSVDDLLEVKGIGRKRLERLRPLLMISAQPKSTVNRKNTLPPDKGPM